MELLVKVNLGKIRRNLRAVRTLTGGRILLMVKADGYGHGMTEVARAVEDEVDMLGVAVTEEGRRLRECGVTAPVLVAVCPPEEYGEAAALGLTVAVCDDGGLARLPEMIAPPDFHIKFDTGMHRLGFSPERADEVFAVLRERALVPSGCYSHFREPCAEQLEIFSYVAARARAYFPDITLHMASSGTVGYPAARFDMVRVGHAAYGGAMSVESRVVAVRHACAGECVGYGHFTLNRDTDIAVVFGGYFDGVRRGSPAVAVIGGRRCPSLGSVCMDMFAVDVGGVRCSVGDRAILMGKELPASEIAAMRGTVDYDVMTGWTGRIKRIYSDDQTGSETEG